MGCSVDIISALACRYIPVGVLEQVPQKINQRPPAFVGRDDLETLMASNNCKDWIKIRYVQYPVLRGIKSHQQIPQST